MSDSLRTENDLATRWQACKLLGVMGHKESTAERARRMNALGYDASFLAHRHRIPKNIAARIIEKIGANRMRLDAAARAWKTEHQAKPSRDTDGSDA